MPHALFKRDKMRKELGVMHESKLGSKVTLIFFNLYSVNPPTIMKPNGLFNEICDATISPFWVILHEQLNCLKHLRGQLHCSIGLDHREKPTASVHANTSFKKKPKLGL